MTRETAISIFKRLKENAPNEMHLETVGSAQELFSMAISALEQQPCVDAISRDAVIEIICRETEWYDIRTQINELPSVTPSYKECRTLDEFIEEQKRAEMENSDADSD